jgi:hypothetical protein
VPPAQRLTDRTRQAFDNLTNVPGIPGTLKVGACRRSITLDLDTIAAKLSKTNVIGTESIHL